MRTYVLRKGLLAATLILHTSADAGATAQASPPAGAAAPAAEDALLAGLARHCGQAFAGRIVANQPAPADDPFAVGLRGLTASAWLGRDLARAIIPHA